MPPKPRILMLASNTPQAIGSGAPVRTYHFARALAALGELSLAVFSTDGQAITADLEQSCRRVIRATSLRDDGGDSRPQTRLHNWMQAGQVLIAPWRDDWAGLLQYALGLCGDSDSSPRAPLSRRALAVLLEMELFAAARVWPLLPMVTFCQRQAFLAIQGELTAVLDRNEIDLVWFEHSFNFPFVEALLKGRKHPLVVCNTHNIESHLAERFERLPASGRSPAWWRTQARLLKKLEGRAFQMSDLVFLCSEQDKRHALDLAAGANVSVVGNGVDTKHFHPPLRRTRASVPTLLFTGVFDYGPNADAVKYFVSDIFPLIKRRVPECRFVFAGRKAQTLFDALGIRDASISCVSDPPDMRPEFERAWVFVAPLLVGGGTRLKILEAMAMKCAVVSTRVGAEGVPYSDGEHLILADTAAEFAAAVSRLLGDPGLRNEMETSAANWVHQRYDWSRLCAEAIAVVRQLPIEARRAESQRLDAAGTFVVG